MYVAELNNFFQKGKYTIQIKTFLSKIKGAFTEHPKATEETYLEHFYFTMKMLCRFIFLGFTITIHGLFPFLFTRTTSDHIEILYQIMKSRVPQKGDETSDEEILNAIPTHGGTGLSRVAIIGGGFCGALAMANLVKQAEDPIILEWFEPSEFLGKGSAYSTKDNVHLLNVVAERMGAFSQEPGDFYRWLQTDLGKECVKRLWPGHVITGKSYVPRVIYGEYINHIINTSLLEAKSKNIIVNIHCATVIDLVLHDEGTQQMGIIFDKSGLQDQLIVDAVILATGNLPPRPQKSQKGSVVGHPNYVNDVWNRSKDQAFPHPVNELSEDTETVILGTGLTMVDAVLTLKSRGYKGKIIAISRTGLLPNTHVETDPYPKWEWVHNPEDAPRTALRLFTGLRQEIRKASENGYSWQSVIDSIRPVTQKLWKQLEIKEKQKFLKRLFTLWNVHRHRMAPEIYQEIKALEQSDRLKIIAGNISYIDSESDKLTITYRKGGTTGLETRSPALILNCTGSEQDIAISHHGLLKQLHNRELISGGLLRVGIESTEYGTAMGKAKGSLYPLGTLLSGELLECTAVPELRDQVHDIARKVLHRVKAIPCLGL